MGRSTCRKAFVHLVVETVKLTRKSCSSDDDGLRCAQFPAFAKMNVNSVDDERGRGESKLLVGGGSELNQYGDDFVCHQAQ